MEKVKVWDLPTRGFHWLIVALVGFSWGSAEIGWMTVHLWSGLMVLTLVIFRILWGFFGSTTARFSNFVKPPKVAIEYVKAIFYGEKPHYAGHNPAGGLMVVGLIAVLLVQAALGLFSHDDILFKGPLAYLVSKGVSDFMTEMHETVFNLLLVLAALHVAAVLFYFHFRKEDLIRPMVTGFKEADQLPPGTKLSFTNPFFAVILLALSGALVWWVIR